MTFRSSTETTRLSGSISHPSLGQLLRVRNETDSCIFLASLTLCVCTRSALQKAKMTFRSSTETIRVSRSISHLGQ